MFNTTVITKYDCELDFDRIFSKLSENKENEINAIQLVDFIKSFGNINIFFQNIFDYYKKMANKIIIVTTNELAKGSKKITFNTFLQIMNYFHNSSEIFYKFLNFISKIIIDQYAMEYQELWNHYSQLKVYFISYFYRIFNNMCGSDAFNLFDSTSTDNYLLNYNDIDSLKILLGYTLECFSQNKRLKKQFVNKIISNINYHNFIHVSLSKILRAENNIMILIKHIKNIFKKIIKNDNNKYNDIHNDIQLISIFLSILAKDQTKYLEYCLEYLLNIFVTHNKNIQMIILNIIDITLQKMDDDILFSELQKVGGIDSNMRFKDADSVLEMPQLIQKFKKMLLQFRKTKLTVNNINGVDVNPVILNGCLFKFYQIDSNQIVLPNNFTVIFDSIKYEKDENKIIEWNYYYGTVEQKISLVVDGDLEDVTVYSNILQSVILHLLAENEKLSCQEISDMTKIPIDLSYELLASIYESNIITRNYNEGENYYSYNYKNYSGDNYINLIDFFIKRCDIVENLRLNKSNINDLINKTRGKSPIRISSNKKLTLK